ncbi:MAG: hypothetical protein D6796_17300 [Caldilineae bacterium]|nr:MAG: hypothetical protein D6796_17300 [Caldilineae bacterium]
MKKRTRILVVLGGVVLCWLALGGLALAQGGDGGSAAAVGGGVLAPLAAAALGIERLLEAVWGIAESIIGVVGKVGKELPDKPEYVRFKTWASAVLGILVGIILASAANLGMFGMLDLPVNHRADVFITGLVIGSGSKFTHDVIGIFYEWKKLIEVRRSERY